MPVLDAPAPAKEQVEDRYPAPGRMVEGRPRGRNASPEVFQHCLDLAVTGNQAAGRAMRRFAETVDQVAHAPFGFARTLVHSAVVVDVDVDVDIASQQYAAQEPHQEGKR